MTDWGTVSRLTCSQTVMAVDELYFHSLHERRRFLHRTRRKGLRYPGERVVDKATLRIQIGSSLLNNPPLTKRVLSSRGQHGRRSDRPTRLGEKYHGPQTRLPNHSIPFLRRTARNSLRFFHRGYSTVLRLRGVIPPLPTSAWHDTISKKFCVVITDNSYSMCIMTRYKSISQSPAIRAIKPENIRSKLSPPRRICTKQCSYFYAEDGGDTFRRNLQDNSPHIQSCKKISNLI